MVKRHERKPVPEAISVDRGDDRLEDLPAALERVDRWAIPEAAGNSPAGLPVCDARSAPAQNARPAQVTASRRRSH
jgi:hypothetical protein